MNITKEQIDEYLKECFSMVEYIFHQRIKVQPAMDIGLALETAFPEQFYHRYGTISAHQVSFKCKSIEEMTPIIKYITLIGGLHQVGEKKQEGLTAKWDFGILKVETTFSGKCHMVQTGEKTVTLPIMEMKCGDE